MTYLETQSRPSFSIKPAYDCELQSSKSNGDTNIFPEGLYLRACQCVSTSIKKLVSIDSVPSSRLYGLPRILCIALQTIHFVAKMSPPRHDCEVFKFRSHKSPQTLISLKNSRMPLRHGFVRIPLVPTILEPPYK